MSKVESQGGHGVWELLDTALKAESLEDSVAAWGTLFTLGTSDVFAMTSWSECCTTLERMCSEGGPLFVPSALPHSEDEEMVSVFVERSYHVMCIAASLLRRMRTFQSVTADQWERAKSVALPLLHAVSMYCDSSARWSSKDIAHCSRECIAGVTSLFLENNRAPLVESCFEPLLQRIVNELEDDERVSIACKALEWLLLDTDAIPFTDLSVQYCVTCCTRLLGHFEDCVMLTGARVANMLLHREPGRLRDGNHHLVLIDYIARSTTSKDPAVLSEVYQAMFACHSLLEDEDLEEKQVEAMSHLRKECLRAAKTPTRLVISKSVQTLLERMGGRCIPYMKDLIPALLYYMLWDDGQVQTNMLNALIALVSSCWPLIPYHWEELKDGLTKCDEFFKQSDVILLKEYLCSMLDQIRSNIARDAPTAE